MFWNAFIFMSNVRSTQFRSYANFKSNYLYGVHKCVCIWAQVHTKARGQCWVSFLRFHPPCFVEERPLPRSYISPIRLVLLEFFCPYLTSLEITSIHYSAWHQLSYLPSPNHTFYPLLPSSQCTHDTPTGVSIFGIPYLKSTKSTISH